MAQCKGVVCCHTHLFFLTTQCTAEHEGVGLPVACCCKDLFCPRWCMAAITDSFLWKCKILGSGVCCKPGTCCSSLQMVFFLQQFFSFHCKSNNNSNRNNKKHNRKQHSSQHSLCLLNSTLHSQLSSLYLLISLFTVLMSQFINCDKTIQSPANSPDLNHHGSAWWLTSFLSLTNWLLSNKSLYSTLTVRLLSKKSHWRIHSFWKVIILFYQL